MDRRSRTRNIGPRARWGMAIVGSCVLAALAVTWPLARHLPTAVPLGSEPAATVPLFSLWTLWWAGDRAGHGFAGYGDAPIFYPNRGVTNYSEPMPLIGLPVAPLWGLGVPPALIYNLALLAVLTLNGVFGYRLSRAVGAPALPALLVGLLTVTLPFVGKHQGVLPNVALFGLLWTLDGLIRFGRCGTTRAALWAATGMAATYYTMQQYALFLVPFAGAAGVLALGQQGWRGRAMLRLAAAGLLAGLLVLPDALPATRVRDAAGFRRSEQTVQRLSARPSDFLTRPVTARIALPAPDAASTGGLFPGTLLLALALGGVAIGLRQRGQRRWVIYLVISALVASLLALGLNLDLAGWRPFATLRALAPTVAGMRSPYCAAVVGQLCLLPLAGLALARLRTLGGGGRRGAALVALVALLGAGENLTPLLALAQVPPTPQTPWTAWVRAQPDTTVVAHVPFPAAPYVWDYEVEAHRMFAQIDHRKPLINGYSGYFPQHLGPDGAVEPTYTRFQLAMAQQFPDRRLLCALGGGLGANLLIVDQGWLADHEPQMGQFGNFLRPAYADQQVQICYLTVPDGQCQAG